MSLTHIAQDRVGLCGAACAQMVLHARGLSGTAVVPDQEQIWSDIKKFTEPLNPELPCGGAVAEQFENMVREACGKRKVICWNTHPDALIALLNDRIGGDKPAARTQSKDQDETNDMIRGCLADGGVPIVLTQRGAHWVVIDGWDGNDSHPVSLLDPAEGEPERLTTTAWNAYFMMAVKCGTFRDNYVVVKVGP